MRGLWIWSFVLLHPACDSSSSEKKDAQAESCKAGTEGCACLQGDQCNPGLTCASRLCVDLSGAKTDPAAKEEPPATKTESPTAAPPSAAPYPKKLLDPASAKVRVTLRTNVVADVLDPVDLSRYGTTNGEGGIEVEQSVDPLELLLRAEGYEDLKFQVVPNRAKEYEKTLVALPTNAVPPKGSK